MNRPPAGDPAAAAAEAPAAPAAAGTASGEFVARFYSELRRLAHARLASSRGHTLLDTTALVHESFLRLQRSGEQLPREREHFLAYAATTMRSVVVDYVRRRRAERRGGDALHVTLNTGVAEALGACDEEILEIHEALETLGQVDARLVQVVEMRYFAGLTELEIARALGISDRTVRRDWERARLLLAGMLGR